MKPLRHRTRDRLRGVRRGAAALSVAVVIALVGAPVYAHDRPTKPLPQMTAEAEMVFDGVVQKVEYAMSDRGEGEDGALPHTFVTYQVGDPHKGRSSEGNTDTLRFLGGPTPDGRFLDVSYVPNFQVGQRDVLFVRRNGDAECPLVDCDKGRFRVISDQLYTNDGVEILMGPGGQIQHGRKLQAPEFRQKKLGNVLFSLKKRPAVADEGEQGKSQYRMAESQLKITGERLNVQSFKAQMGQHLKMLKPEQLQALQPVRSLRVGERFKAKSALPFAAPAPRLMAAQLAVPQSQFDQMEAEALRQNQGNPVLKTAPPSMGPGVIAPSLPPVLRRGVDPEGAQPPSGPEGQAPTQ